MDSKGRNDLVRNVSLKLASSKAAVKAFAQAMASAENDRSKLKEAHRLAQTRVKELKTLNERLKRENDSLMKQNAALNHRVEEVQTQASAQVATMETRQQEYQETIALLKKQIRSSETSVSMALYQRTATESKVAQKQLEEKTLHIKQLETKLDLVQQLGRQMKEQYEKSIRERERVLEVHLQTESLQQLHNDEQEEILPIATLQEEMQLRQQRGKERRLQETEKVRALLEMPPLALKVDGVRTPRPSGGKLVGKYVTARKYSPAKQNSTPVTHRPPPPPPHVSPDGSTPSPLQSVKRKMDPPASMSPPYPPPPPRPAVPPMQAVAMPPAPRGLPVPKLQKFPIAIFACEGIPSPPPPKLSPVSSPSPKVTQRAYKRLSAITAAGGRNSIREKLNTIRRSPLGNATNTIRGVGF